MTLNFLYLQCTSKENETFWGDFQSLCEAGCVGDFPSSLSPKKDLRKKSLGMKLKKYKDTQSRKFARGFFRWAKVRRSLTSLNTSFVASSFKLASATCSMSHTTTDFKPFFFLLYWVLCMAQQLWKLQCRCWPWDHAALNSFLTEKGPKMTLETKRAASKAGSNTASAQTLSSPSSRITSVPLLSFKSPDGCLKRARVLMVSVKHYYS